MILVQNKYFVELWINISKTLKQNNTIYVKNINMLSLIFLLYFKLFYNYVKNIKNYGFTYIMCYNKLYKIFILYSFGEGRETWQEALRKL